MKVSYSNALHLHWLIHHILFVINKLFFFSLMPLIWLVVIPLLIVSAGRMWADLWSGSESPSWVTSPMMPSPLLTVAGPGLWHRECGNILCPPPALPCLLPRMLCFDQLISFTISTNIFIKNLNWKNHLNKLFSFNLFLSFITFELTILLLKCRGWMGGPWLVGQHLEM